MTEHYYFDVVCTGLDHVDEDFEQKFYDQGCEDSVVSYMNGMIVVGFAVDRDAPEAGIADAVAKVRRTGATVVRVEPDNLVTLSEAGHRSGLSWPEIFTWSRYRDFPLTVARVTTDRPLYHWPDVARFLLAHDRMVAGEIALADALASANASIERSAARPVVDAAAIGATGSVAIV